MRWLVVLLVLANGTCDASSLFEDDEALNITLAGPVRTLVKDKARRREHPFTLTVDGISLDVEVRVRGNSRVEACRFPPLRLRFPSSGTSNTVFSGENTLKLVTHCQKSADSEQNVLEEYAAYRIFNLLSDVSFRTRLLRISYVDTKRPGADALLRYAFLIEPKAALAARHNGVLLSVRRATRNYLDESQATLSYIFQYLISNTDWSLVRAIDSDTCCHNGELIEIGGRHFYTPYDFDMSGLVNARYAKPNPELRLHRVTQRRYRGYCTGREALRDSLRAILSKRDEILDVVRQLPGLAEKAKASRLDFLGLFFDKADDEEKLLRQFEGRCL